MMNRNKFFSVVGLGLVGVLLSKIVPFKFTSGKIAKNKKVNVKINPLAIKREKVARKHV